MSKLRNYLSAGRSLATATAVGRGSPGRGQPLELPNVPDIDPGRAAELGSLLDKSDFAGLQAEMAAGATSAVELTTHLLHRVAVEDSSLNSLIAASPDALEQARAADDRRAAGAVGPLLGIPITCKDNIETAGPMATTGGAVVLAGHVAASDAPVVAALRAAGAVILGKANLSELAGAAVRTPGFSAVGGQVGNPYGPGFSPAGSSSGSAAGVAAGLTLGSVGTETSGSLITPAAYCGLVGMKPSRGLLPGEGVIPLVRFQDSAGPLARCVADAATLLGVLAGQPELAGSLSDDALAGVRVGVLRADITSQRSPLEDTSDAAEMLARIDRALAAAGALSVAASPVSAEPLDQLEARFLTVVLGGLTHDTIGYLAAADTGIQTLADLHSYNLAQPRRRMPRGQFFISWALTRDISKAQYEDAALDHRERAARILDATFAAADAPLLVSISNRHSMLYATAGYPAVTVPLGLRANGMPTGATLIGRPGTDAALLGYAHAFERAGGYRVPVAQG